jgi:hypothetical protein
LAPEATERLSDEPTPPPMFMASASALAPSLSTTLPSSEPHALRLHEAWSPLRSELGNPVVAFSADGSGFLFRRARIEFSAKFFFEKSGRVSSWANPAVMHHGIGLAPSLSH